MKTPKEKAIELVDEMYNVDYHDDDYEYSMQYKHAILCAMVAVDEILLHEKNNHSELDKITDYWQEVKQEINKI